MVWWRIEATTGYTTTTYTDAYGRRDATTAGCLIAAGSPIDGRRTATAIADYPDTDASDTGWWASAIIGSPIASPSSICRDFSGAAISGAAAPPIISILHGCVAICVTATARTAVSAASRAAVTVPPTSTVPPNSIGVTAAAARSAITGVPAIVPPVLPGCITVEVIESTPVSHVSTSGSATATTTSG